MGYERMVCKLGKNNHSLELLPVACLVLNSKTMIFYGLCLLFQGNQKYFLIIPYYDL